MSDGDARAYRGKVRPLARGRKHSPEKRRTPEHVSMTRSRVQEEGNYSQANSARHNTGAQTGDKRKFDNLPRERVKRRRDKRRRELDVHLTSQPFSATGGETL